MPVPTYSAPEVNAKRQTVNAFIRSMGIFRPTAFASLRGEPASKVASTLAGELALLAETYQQCAALPEAAERDLDAARAVTFRALAGLHSVA